MGGILQIYVIEQMFQFFTPLEHIFGPTTDRRQKFVFIHSGFVCWYNNDSSGIGTFLCDKRSS